MGLFSEEIASCQWFHSFIVDKISELLVDRRGDICIECPFFHYLKCQKKPGVAH